MSLNKIEIIKHLEKQLKASHEKSYLETESKHQQESPLSPLFLWSLIDIHLFFLQDVSPFFPLEAIPSQAVLTLVLFSHVCL